MKRLNLGAILLVTVSCLAGHLCQSEPDGTKEVLIAVNPAGGEVKAFFPVHNRWETVSVAMPGPQRLLAAGAILNNQLFICGGRNDRTPAILDSCVTYLPAENRWLYGDDATMAPLPSARYDFVMAATSGKLYALGGRTVIDDNDYGSELFDVYDPQTNSWRSLSASLSRFRDHPWKPTLAGYNGNLYMVAFGGRVKQPYPTPYQYSPDLNVWTDLQPLSPPRAGVALIVDDTRGLIWAVGGSTDYVLFPTDRVERYNASQPQSAWEHNNGECTCWEGYQLTSKRTGPAMSGAKVGNRLYVVGGGPGPDERMLAVSGVVEYLPAGDAAKFRIRNTNFKEVARLESGIDFIALSVHFRREFIDGFLANQAGSRPIVNQLTTQYVNQTINQ